MPNSGSYFYDYKGYLNIVLLAVVDANSEFIFVVLDKLDEYLMAVIENTMFYKIWEADNLIYLQKRKR